MNDHSICMTLTLDSSLDFQLVKRTDEEADEDLIIAIVG